MRYFNEFYSYDDIGLWDEKTWEGKECKGAPLFQKVIDLTEPLKECYPDRKDEHTDLHQRQPYFDDVVAWWKERGLIFNACGMMGMGGFVMVPKSVAEHRKYDPKVLYIPLRAERGAPHTAMNALKAYEELLMKAAAEEVLVQFISHVGFMEMGLETQGTLKISYDPVYLDLTSLKTAGLRLQDIPGVDPADYPPETTLLGLPVVDVSDKWQDNLEHQVSISRMYRKNQKEWDYEMQVHSALGKAQAESFHMEYDYLTPHDPRMAAHWEKKGLIYEDHYLGHDWWITLAPKSITTKPQEKLPLLCIMKEPRTAIPQAMQTAFQFYYDWLELAAQGQFIALYFALETPDDNDILAEIIAEAEKAYPIDPQRIYLTGQSHNGYYALEFYRRHPDLIAAAATLADPIGLELGAMMSGVYDADPEAAIRSFAAHDMPLINFNGELENKYISAPRGSELEKRNAEYFRWRLRAFRCPERSMEEIIAARDSEDYVTRKNGIPADRTEVQFVLGTELYISDLKNVDGKWHLRFVTQENLPHMIVPQMAQVCWSYIRRFARDRETGATIERY